MTQTAIDDTVIYRTSPRYKVLVAAGIVLSGLLGWEVWRAFTASPDGDVPWGFLFFFVMMLLVTLWYVREMASVVTLSPEALSVLRRPGAPEIVDFRQMVSVSEAGRLGGRSITVIFHPLCADGLVDLDGAASLIVPEVDDHDGLLAALEARVPA